MKNLFKKTEFMLGVTKYKNLPEDVGSEVLLAGRSNAGKSSLLNSMTRSKIAQISREPGKTRKVNLFFCDYHKKVFVDLPGYGFAKRICK